MSISRSVSIGGSVFSDYFSCVVRKSFSENNLVGTFDLNFPNDYGLHSTDFSVGQDVQITISGVSFFGGTVEEVTFNGFDSATSERIKVYGRDYTSKLQNVTVEPTVFLNLDAGSIARSLVAREAPSITTVNTLDTGYVIPSIRFSHLSLFDAIKQLCSLAGDYYFYIDTTNDLNLKPLNVTSSSFSFSSDNNILSCQVTEANREQFNQVWVYGDRFLTEAPTVFRTQSGTGSIFTVDWKPHNTAVYSSLFGGGSKTYYGGVLNFVGQGDPGSPTQYLVDYENQQIIFVSGTNAGDWIPTSGTNSNIKIQYDRNVPITRYAQDNASIDLYGAREKFIVDKNIKDPRTATAIAYKTLDREAYPVKSISAEINGWYDLTPGTTAGVYIPAHNISGASFTIFQADYVFNKQTYLNNNYLTVSLNKKLLDGVDIIKNALLDITRLKAQELETDDLYTRLEASIGSVMVLGSVWSVSTGGLGSSFVLNHPTLGKLGTGLNPQPYLGDSRAAKTVQRSGGDW